MNRKISLSDISLSWIVTGVFFITALSGILHHEMWRDEFQAWMIVKASHNLTELFHNIRYEGHPFVWFIILYGLKYISTKAIIMQITHVLIASASVFFITRYAPFTKLQRTMLAFGYFTLFEYALISRNYAIGMFFVVLFCTLYIKNKPMLWQAVVLFLLANTSIYGLIISGGLAFFILIEQLINQYKSLNYKKGLLLVSCAIIVILGFLLSWNQIQPPADSSFPVDWPDGLERDRLKLVLTTFFTTIFPISKLQLTEFWNTNLFWNDFHFSSSVINGYVFLSLCLLAIVSLYFYSKNKAVGIAFIATIIVLMLLFYITNRLFYRYTGSLFVSLIAFWWLAELNQSKVKNKILNVSFKILVFSLLIIQLILGMHAWSKDISKPFSNARETAQYIQQEGFDKEFLFGSTDFIISSLSEIINKPIYYPEIEGYATYMIWSKNKKWNMNIGEVLASATNQVNKGNENFVMILSAPIRYDEKRIMKEDYITPGIKMKLLKSFDRKHLCGSENYYIYRVYKEK